MYFFLRHGKYTRTYFAMYGMQSKQWSAGMAFSLKKGLQVEYIFCHLYGMKSKQWSAGMACSLKKRIAGTVDYKFGNVRHAV